MKLHFHSKTVVTFYTATQRHNREDYNLNFRIRGISYNVLLYYALHIEIT
jgi:hypothetical protein